MKYEKSSLKKNIEKTELNNGELIYYPELLDRAHKEGLKGISTRLIQIPSKENQFTAVVFAKVRTNRGVFTGHGDASLTNVDLEIAPHIIRAAETRAKARALRDAVNVGVVAAEELGGGVPSRDGQKKEPESSAGNGQPADGRRAEETAEVRPLPLEDKTDGKPSEPLMTDAQKRYLFRLMAMQGMEGDVAQTQLKKLFAVDSLKKATKVQASRLIEELVAQAER